MAEPSGDFSLYTSMPVPSAKFTSPRARGQWSGVFISSVTGQPHGMPITHSSARSSPVNAATTPG